MSDKNTPVTDLSDYLKQKNVAVKLGDDEKSVYKCLYCLNTYSNYYALWTHKKNLHPDKHAEETQRSNSLVSCEHCGKMMKAMQYSAHLTFHKNHEQMISCPICNEKFTYKSKLENHMKMIHAEKDAVVTESSENNDAEEENIIKEKVASVAPSGQDNSVFDPADLVIELKCFDCNVDFKENSAYRKHIATHKNYRKYLCRKCNKRFITLTNLKNHIRSLHLDIPKSFECKFCKKKFSLQHHMIVHERTHTAHFLCARPYRCTFCAASFADVSAHKRHEDMHRNGNEQRQKTEQSRMGNKETSIPMKTRSKDDEKDSTDVIPEVMGKVVLESGSGGSDQDEKPVTRRKTRSSDLKNSKDKRRSAADEDSDDEQDNNKQSTSKNSSMISPLAERNPRRATRGKKVNYKDLLDIEIEKKDANASGDSTDASSEYSDYEPEEAVVESEASAHENSEDEDELPSFSNRTTKSVKKKHGKLVEAELNKTGTPQSSTRSSTVGVSTNKESGDKASSSSGKSPTKRTENDSGKVYGMFSSNYTKKPPVKIVPVTPKVPPPKIVAPTPGSRTPSTITPRTSIVPVKAPEVKKEPVLKMVDDTKLKGLIRTSSEGYFADFERIVDIGRKVDRRQKIALYRLKDVITSAADKAAVEATVEKFIDKTLTEKDVLDGTIGLMVPEHHVERNKGRKASDVNPILLVTNRVKVSAFKKIKFTKSLWERSPKWITEARPILEIDILGVSDRFFKSKIDEVTAESMLEINTARSILDYEEQKSSDGDVINVIRGFVSTMEDKKSEHWKKFIETRILATGDTTLKYIFLLCTAPDDLYKEFYEMVDLNPGILNSKVLVTIIAKIVEDGGKINKVIEELKKINAQMGSLTVEEIREKLKEIPTPGVTLFEDIVVEPTVSAPSSEANFSAEPMAPTPTPSLPPTPKLPTPKRTTIAKAKPDVVKPTPPPAPVPQPPTRVSPRKSAVSTPKQEVSLSSRKRRTTSEVAASTSQPLIKKEKPEDAYSEISEISGLSESVSVVAAKNAKQVQYQDLPIAEVQGSSRSSVKTEIKTEIVNERPNLMVEETPWPLSTLIFQKAQSQQNEKMIIWTQDLDADLISTVNIFADRCIIVSQKMSTFPLGDTTGNMLKQLGARTIDITQLISNDDVIQWTLISLGQRPLPASLRNKLVRSYAQIEQIVTDLIVPDPSITVANMVRHSKDGLFPVLRKELKGKIIACNFMA